MLDSIIDITMRLREAFQPAFSVIPIDKVRRIPTEDHGLLDAAAQYEIMRQDTGRPVAEVFVPSDDNSVNADSLDSLYALMYGSSDKNDEKDILQSLRQAGYSFNFTGLHR